MVWLALNSISALYWYTKLWIGYGKNCPVCYDSSHIFGNFSWRAKSVVCHKYMGLFSRRYNGYFSLQWGLNLTVNYLQITNQPLR